MDVSLLFAPLPPPEGGEAALAKARKAMVATQLRSRDIRDPKVLEAMGAVPRHRFVPNVHQALAHADHPLPIGRGQTISQPYIVAYMAQALRLTGSERVLEVGSGSGYALAVLARLARRVHGIELEAELHDRARVVLDDLGLSAIQTRCGDGWKGWPEAAPFDAILVSCAPESVPKALLDQLAPGGRMVVPLGPQGSAQVLLRVTRTPKGLLEERLLPVSFVPMRGGLEPPRKTD